MERETRFELATRSLEGVRGRSAIPSARTCWPPVGAVSRLRDLSQGRVSVGLGLLSGIQWVERTADLEHLSVATMPNIAGTDDDVIQRLDQIFEIR